MAMFENFPYTDMHNLNLDWIIKIAKDFLDQYTHIQQLIADGEESLQNLTEEGLQQLQDKADALETLLNEWYDTHSQDIANQLADALNDLGDWYTDHLADLNSWYTTHLNYLNDTLIAKIAEFNVAAEAKAAETLESIPDDYSELAEAVNLLEIDDSLLKQIYKGVNVSDNTKNESGFINYQDGTVVSHASYYHTGYIPIKKGVTYGLAGMQSNHFAMYDIHKTYIANETNDIVNALNGSTINSWWVFTAAFDGFMRFTVSGANQYSNVVPGINSRWFETHTFNAIYEYSDSAIIPLNVAENKNLIDLITYIHNGTNACDNSANASGFISWETGEVVTHSTYYHTDYIRIIKGCRYGIAGSAPQHMARYDINKTFMPASTNSLSATLKTRNINSWDVFVADFDGYIRLTVTSSSGRVNVVIAEEQSFFNANPYNGTYKFEYPQITPIKERKIINIKQSEGINTFYSKMKQAFNTGNCDVIIEHGTYEITNALVDAIRAEGLRGIPIGNGCRYYFNSATVVCNYTGSNTHDVADLFSPLDAQNIASDFEIYDLTLYALNVCYALHDDANGGDFCRHIYQNCHIELNNNAVAAADGNIYSKALGGGLAAYEELIIRDCMFKGVNPYSVTDHMQDVSFHDANNSAFTNAKIVITGCYFANQFRGSDLSGSPSNPRPHIIFSNNSCAYAPDISGSWTKYEWNTNVR